MKVGLVEGLTIVDGLAGAGGLGDSDTGLGGGEGVGGRREGGRGGMQGADRG